MASSDAVPGSSVVGQTLPRPETEPDGTAGTMAAPIRPAGRRGRYRLRGVSAVGAAVLVALLVTMQLRGGAAHSVFFGLALPAADLRQLSAFEAASGCQPSVFAQSVKLDSPSFTVAALNDISSAGMTPFLTLEPWSFRSVSGQAEQPQYALRTIIRGDHDGPLLAVADVLAAYGKPVYLRFAHEMNAHWYPWGEANGNSPGEYVMAWRHVHRLLGALDPQISWVWSPAAVQQTRVTARLASLYPGDDYVNFVGVTGYARSGNRDSHAADTFDGTLRQIRAFTDKPVVLSEIGADGPRKSRWLASLGPYLRHHSDIRGFVYFNTSPGSTGATGTYELRRAADFVTFHTSLAAADSCARPATRPAASPDHSTGPAASFG